MKRRCTYYDAKGRVFAYCTSENEEATYSAGAYFSDILTRTRSLKDFVQLLLGINKPIKNDELYMEKIAVDNEGNEHVRQGLCPKCLYWDPIQLKCHTNPDKADCTHYINCIK